MSSLDSLNLRDVDALIDACRAAGTLFEDEAFPAAPASIAATPPRSTSAGSRGHSRSGPLAATTGWKRPAEIFPGQHVAVFKDGSAAGDVMQGALGDCYLLGALSVLATRPELLAKLVLRDAGDVGLYCMAVYKDGLWRAVVIDDQLPVSGSRLAFASCRDAGELWVPLYEKAYAKIHGNYAALEGGSVAQALVDATGGASEKIDVAKNDAKEKRLWATMERHVNAGFLMGVAFLNKDVGIEKDRGKGVVANHAYGVLQLATVGPRNERIIRLRNPWGKGEWRGAWADGSKEWTRKIQQELKYRFADDGTFWMSYADFCASFTKLYVCRLYDDDIGARWDRQVAHGEWTSANSGGCLDHGTWRENNQYLLRVQGQPGKKTRAFLVLAQADARMAGRPAPQTTAIGCYVLRGDGDQVLKTLAVDRETDIVASSRFAYTREVSFEVVLEAGQNYAVMPCTYDAGSTGTYTLTVYCQNNIKLVPAVEPVVAEIGGQWSHSSAGGCPNNSSWARNPQYGLRALEPTNVTVLLVQPKVRAPKELNHIGCQILRGGDGAPKSGFLQADDVVAEAAYSNDVAVAASFTLHDEAVVLVPNTFLPAKTGDFTLRIYASEPLVVGPLRKGEKWAGIAAVDKARRTGELAAADSLVWADFADEDEDEDEDDAGAYAAASPVAAAPASSRSARSAQYAASPAHSARSTWSESSNGSGMTAARSARRVPPKATRSEQEEYLELAEKAMATVQGHVEGARRAQEALERDTDPGRAAMARMSHNLWSRVNPGYQIRGQQLRSHAKEEYTYDPEAAEKARIPGNNLKKNDMTAFVQMRAQQEQLLKRAKS